MTFWVWVWLSGGIVTGVAWHGYWELNLGLYKNSMYSRLCDFLCVSVFFLNLIHVFVCMYTHHVQVYESRRGSWGRDGCKPPFGCWEQNLGLSKDCLMFLITNLSSPVLDYSHMCLCFDKVSCSSRSGLELLIFLDCRQELPWSFGSLPSSSSQVMGLQV